MSQYDPAILAQFADELDRRAQRAPLAGTNIGLLLGLLLIMPGLAVIGELLGGPVLGGCKRDRSNT